MSDCEKWSATLHRPAPPDEIGRLNLRGIGMRLGTPAPAQPGAREPLRHAAVFRSLIYDISHLEVWPCRQAPGQVQIDYRSGPE